MTKSTAKGTKWDVELLDKLRMAFMKNDIERSAKTLGTNDRGDFLNLPCEWLIEAKNANTPAWKSWLRTVRRKSYDFHLQNWVIFWHGDRRTEDGQPAVLMSEDLALELIHVYQFVGHNSGRFGETSPSAPVTPANIPTPWDVSGHGAARYPP